MLLVPFAPFSREDQILFRLGFLFFFPLAGFCSSTDSAADQVDHHTASLVEAPPEHDSEIQSSKPSLKLAGLKAAFAKKKSPEIGTTAFNNSSVCSGPAQKTMQSFFSYSEKANSMRERLGSPSCSTSETAVSPPTASSSGLNRFKRSSDADIDSGVSEPSSTTGTPETMLGKRSEFSPSGSASDEPSIKTEPVEKVPGVSELPEQNTELTYSPERIFSPEAKKLKRDDDPPEQRQPPSATVKDRSTGLFDRPVSVQKKMVPLKFSMTELCRRMERLQALRTENDQELKYRRFRAKINPGDNQSAEDELKKEIR